MIDDTRSRVPVSELSSAEWARAAVVALAVLAVGWLIGPKTFFVADTVHYYDMVVRSVEAAQPPFAYRALVPLIVRVLPFDPSIGFFLTTYGSSFAALVGMYRLWRALGVSSQGALLTLPLLGFSFPIAFYLGSWGLIDPMPYMFMVLALASLATRRYLLATALVAIGCISKETCLLLVPVLVWVIVRRGPEEGRGWRALVAVVLPVAVFIAVRKAITPAPGQWDIKTLDDALRQLGYIWSYNVSGFGLPLRIGREVLRSYGFVWVTALLGFRLQRVWRLETLYLAAAGLGLCLIATDWSRMLGWGFPGLFIPTAIFIDRVWTTLGPRVPAVLVGLAVVQGYVSLVAFKDLGRLGQMLLIGGSAGVFVVGGALCLWASRQLPREEVA